MRKAKNRCNFLKMSERAYKPDSVFTAKSHRSLEAAMPSLAAEAIIPLGRRSLDGSMQPTRGFGENAVKRSHAQRAGPALPSYLALHRAGFTVPRTLLSAR